MTIRRRLSFSFLVILLLFAVNLVIYFWGNQRRQSTVEALRRAVSRQALLSTLSQNLNDIQKQVTLLNQVATETASTGAAPEEAVQFKRQLQDVKGEIGELRDLAEPEDQANINAFAEAYNKLGASWQVFYENFGVDQTKAITELAVRTEPLAQEVIQKRLPELKSDEKAHVDAASTNFYEVAQLTDRITILIFALSAAVAVGVAVLVSGQLARGLTRLKEGATMIGSGHLEQRIDVKSNDELSDLAAAFNDMTEKLSLARNQLTRANDQEKKKNEEIEMAMDQLRKAQDQLVVQQKLASLGSLTAGIAHEIKNPLNFVTNFAEISVSLVDELQESLKTQKQQLDPKEVENIEDILKDLQQNVTKIQEHGKRADGIVRNMLMHSRGHSGDRHLTNLNSLLSEYVKLAYHGMRAQNQNFNVGIEENLDRSLEPVSVVAHDLSRVFLNIANNACYAAYEKKQRLGDGFSPVVSASTTNLESSVEIRIRDNGDGMPESVRKRIFEPFFTTKPTGSGTGLGLSMSYEIVVQQHKGQLRVESEPGQYAEFIVTIPKEHPNQESLMPFKVLIVDDEPDLEVLIRQRFRKRIKDGEFEFVFAHDGQEALNKLKEDPALDVVMSDINMPVMDGLTLLSRLSDMNRILKAVIVSAYGDMQNIRTAMNRGAYDFLIKPIDFQDFEVTLNKTIQELESIKQGLRAQEQLTAIQMELSVAARIQQSILPKLFPPFPGRTEFEIYAQMTPAREVGGDFYDFFLIDQNRLGFVIGDVSGKGVPAAIFMAVSRTLLKATALQSVSAGECLKYVNDVLIRQSDSSMFVTIFYGILHISTGELEYCMAGHNPPFVLSESGAVKVLDEPGSTIARVFENATFETGQTTLSRGDCIFLFTDGVTQAVGTDGEFFSDGRLRSVLERSVASAPEEIVGNVLSEVRIFSAASPADDITVLALKYLGS